MLFILQHVHTVSSMSLWLITQSLRFPLHIILCTSLFHSLSTVTAGAKPLAPALFVFGDSLFDAGNNNLLLTLAKVNYYPYGVDFARGATGRFTNGKNVADFIAEYLGLPYPPPVLKLPTPISYTGFNYASGLCGILDETGSIVGKCLNLKDQVNLFKFTTKLVLRKRYTNNNDLSHYLSNSIFIFSIGNNDYIINYLNPIYNTSKRYDPQQFSQLLIDHLSNQLQILYNQGARKVLLFELGPIGCTPGETRTTKHNGLCNEDINRMISLFNERLGLLVSNLNSILPRARFVLAQAHDIGYDAIINPSKYGLINSRDPCCTTLLNGTLTCIPGLPPCKKRDKYYFWDGFHPTEALFSTLTSSCINGSICKPNIQQLIQDI